jgi:plastocyanin
MPLFESRTEIFGWIMALIVVVAMGVIVFTGPYHKVNKPPSASAASALAHPAQTVRIVTNPATVAAYEPKTVTIHLGQAVAFKNVSNLVHTVTANDNSFNSGDIATGGVTWVFRPKKAGTFKYYCIYHPFMHGTLVVQG